MLNAHNAFICPRRQNMSPCPCSVAGQVLILVCEYQVLVNINISDIPSRPNLWSATRHHLTVPRFRLSTFGRRAFSVAGPTVWNSLTDSLRDPALTSSSFRQSLKTNLFRRYQHTQRSRDASWLCASIDSDEDFNIIIIIIIIVCSLKQLKH